ncbi:hypothetical protein CYMTET_25081, partial [Cymbomonas tetramitiformis]
VLQRPLAEDTPIEIIQQLHSPPPPSPPPPPPPPLPLTRDLFVLKVIHSGSVDWVVEGGGTGDDIGRDIAMITHSDIYISGYFDSETATFGNTTLTRLGWWDMLLLKMDLETREVTWGIVGGGRGPDYAHAVVPRTPLPECIWPVPEGCGSLYVTGSFWDEATFGKYVLNAHSTSRRVDTDLFVLEVDVLSGEVLWAVSSGGSLTDRGYAAATVRRAGGSGNDARDGAVFITGPFKSWDGKFGRSTETPLATNGGSDLFVMK